MMLATVAVLLLFSTYALDNETNETIQKNEKLLDKPVVPKRKPVVLNMKQGLIMNQVVTTYALANSKDVLCKNHSREYQDGLRAFEPWALKMFDSSSKLQSGIFAGNLMEYGSFKQCINIKFESQYGPIKGKHCLVKIRPDMDIVKKIVLFRGISEERYEIVKTSLDGASLHWSVCIPDSCSYKDVLVHFNKTILSFTEGLDIDVSMNELDCHSLDDEQPLNKNEWIVLSGCFIFLGIILICTAIDIYKRTKDVQRNQVVAIFSIISNTEYVISDKDNDKELKCLHGIRFLSILYVVFGHRFLMTLFFPSVNALEVLEWLTLYGSTIIIGGTVSVDTFFLMSGLLVSYHFFNHVSNGGKFNIFLFYFHRYLRLTPPYASVILFLATFSSHLGSGPLWNKVAMFIQKPCQYFWWTSLLYLQNYTNAKYICILQSWYLICDVWYYIFSPVLMYPLWKWGMLGKINLLVFYLLSVAINFYAAWLEQYKAGMLVDNQLTTSKYFTQHYILPHIRASPYILGIGFGYILHNTKNNAIKMGYPVLVAGWLLSIALLMTVLLSNNKFQVEGYVYNRLEASSFISMNRSAWTFGVMWIIWVCRAGYGGPVNTILSAHLFQVLGKLSYSIFLIHMALQFLSGGANKLPLYFSNYFTIQRAFGDICITTILSFFLTILVEYPSVRISLYLFKSGKPKVIPDKVVQKKEEVDEK